MRIVIVKLSAIGDIVHALPAVAALRRALPAAHLTWVVEKRAAAILRDSPVIDELIELDTRAWRKRLFSRTTLAEIRERLGLLHGNAGVDLAIDFQGLMKSGLVLKATQARRRVGLANAELREPLSRVFLTEQVNTSSFRHVIEKNLALARAAVAGLAELDATTFAPGAYEFPIAVSEDDERYAEAAANQHATRFALLNPGGGWPTKLWPVERFGELADQLYEQHGLASYVTFGPGEEALAQAVVHNTRSGAAQTMASTLKQFVALARRAALFVGGDTGPLHLAAAAGAPIVGIYGPTSPERNGPFNPQDISVGRDLWCRADCHRRACWHWECMDIPVSVVARAAAVRLTGSSESAPALVHLY
ncbi:MAG TPA: lipopolysaccharide heptosyltransferase I [Blastocatellia bacterium]|nr:lipopolysaccharide heptosyltransferase I [Blastocatellia bacterium]